MKTRNTVEITAAVERRIVSALRAGETRHSIAARLHADTRRIAEIAKAHGVATEPGEVQLSHRAALALIAIASSGQPLRRFGNLWGCDADGWRIETRVKRELELQRCLRRNARAPYLTRRGVEAAERLRRAYDRSKPAQGLDVCDADEEVAA